MLSIKNLNASINNKNVLNGINLEINSGETHVIMGPNGSGKSSLAALLAGNPNYTIESGSIYFLDENITEVSAEDRANKGIFMAFQYPVEIPGIKNSYFIKTALNNKREYNNQPTLNPGEFVKLLSKKSELLKIDKSLTKRSLNDGFSGGEKKINEILQLAILEPKLCILDEIDSGLDIDALENVGNSISKIKSTNNAFLIITHYPRILKYIKPTKVHVLIDGVIVKTQNHKLVDEIEKKGYDWLKN